MKPIIGITSNYSTHDYHGTNLKIGAPEQEWQLLADDYIYSIKEAGGIPVILPVLSEVEDIKSLLSKIDGLLLSGGSDIDPKYYNQSPKEGLGGLMPKRDAYELELAKIALYETDLPILGICRGCQTLTVVSGGTLNQDTRYQAESPFKHAIVESPKHLPSHDASLEVDSKLYKVFGVDKLGINSFHHQSIDRLGKYFLATMHASDETIEAIELSGERFVIGTQWHPEMMVEKNPSYMKVFEAFVESCQNDR
ncbi:gamma-glutamyl-gamma-aminobutyrate hydrolase family protein [Acidaminobacter sp. JC074]|uniref:gamma-glutamyl-gamma-aminobutyrate hydrolase family protein n=1 Tax=Acidaminobacter sp. JC074 TaxID=2530199 RepID=UPI001F0EFAF0|nr:gamma-glutamyl-gamma-aminobutyrate hydrolase family protein [Acidaminobacter sp. JC074]